jgi:general secretion pathway protein D
MLGFNNLRSIVAVLAVLLLLPVEGLEAKNRKGDKLLKLGSDAEARQDFDAALDFYQQAVNLDPKDAGYQVAVRRVRFRAGEAHVEKGMKLKQAHQLEQALVEFQKAFNMDPGSAVAVQEIREVSEALDQQRKGKVLPGDAGLTSAEKSRKESLAMINSLQPVPELKPVSNQITSLKMNNQPPRVLYETVGKLAGINVLFDPQMQPGRNSNLDLSNVTLDEALDYIALLTKTYWKPISSNAIFVTEDNVTKRRDYEDEVVKVFYLRNPTSVQEFQEIVTGVRSVSDVRRMFTFNAQNAVMVRDTVDKVALVEKLFHDMDKPKAEVVVDVIVMEANSDVTRSLGSGLVSGGTNGLSIPLAFTPRNSVTTTNNNNTGTTNTGTLTGTPTTTTTTTTTGSSGGAVALSQLKHIASADFSTTLPGSLLQAVMSDNNTKVLQSPEVRASDGQKVSLKIGDKVPYATGSFQPGIGTVGVSPLVSTQFQFAETGVNVEITPHVHGTDEMTLHVVIDVSNVSSNVNIGGLSQPVISQRKNEADIRLRDGEVSLLGGLMQTQDTGSINGIPGLVNIPVLGKYLFGTTSKERINRQLLIALIPHVVRAPDITELDLRGIAAGTDQTVKLSYAPHADEQTPPAGSTPAGSTPPAPSAAVPTPAGSTAPAAPSAAASTTPAPPVTAPTAPPAPPPAGGAGRITFTPATVQTQLSSTVILGLQADNMTDLAAVPIKIRWDPKILRLERIAPGSLLIQDGNVTAPSLDIRNDTGDASVDINRVAGTAGVNGSGPLMVFQFTAVGKGSSTVSVSEMNLKTSKQEPLSLAAPSVTVTVQ